MKNYLAQLIGKATFSLKNSLESLTLPYRIFLVLRSLFKYGYLEISTSFKYQGATHTFRTLIQPDADVINIIPDVTKLGNDSKILSLIRKNHKVHQAKMLEIFSVLEKNTAVGEKFFSLLLVFANAVPIYKTASDSSNENLIMTGSFLGASFLFNKFLKQKIVAQLMKGFFKMVKKMIS